MAEKSDRVVEQTHVNRIWKEREVRVESFDEFVREIQHLLTVSQSEQRMQYWFRGQSNKAWDLTPSVLRITGQLNLNPEEAIELEKAAREEFIYNAHLYVNADLLNKVKTHPCWWAVMQHHGAPTRLLDWSTSPYVAAYFAAHQDGEGSDGAIWCFCTDPLRTDFNQQYGDVLPDFTKSQEEDIEVAKLHKFLEDPRAVQAVAPLTFKFASSERIAKQQGAFTMCLRIHQDHNCLSQQVGPENVRKIIIPHDIKSELLVQLRMMNITASSMFPGIDGLGRSVAELASLGTNYKKVCGLNGVGLDQM